MKTRSYSKVGLVLAMALFMALMYCARCSQQEVDYEVALEDTLAEAVISAAVAMSDEDETFSDSVDELLADQTLSRFLGNISSTLTGFTKKIHSWLFPTTAKKVKDTKSSKTAAQPSSDAIISLFGKLCKSQATCDSTCAKQVEGKTQRAICEAICARICA